MKNIYFIQPSNLSFHSVYLPYASGSIAAYAWQFREIRDTFALKRFFFLKENIPSVIERMEDPFLVGFSSYIWNITYNLSLAAAIKEKWPDCLILFGGPQIPEDDSYLRRYGQIDLLIFGEGEVPFFRLLSCLSRDGDLRSVENIAFRSGAEPVCTPRAPACDIADFPSPYGCGLFDGILQDPEYRELQFDAIVETNRGCPYRCAYCTWGNNRSRIRMFPMERVKNDLHWFALHRIAFVFCADANFGMFSRDEEVVDEIVALKEKCGYPEKFSSNAAKIKEDYVFRLYQKLDRAHMHKGVSIACQSMSPEVLEIIGRKNIGKEALSHKLKKYRAANISNYIELILALPGETLDSYCRGFFDIIEAGAHGIINVYECELLPNSRMAEPSFMQKYRIETIRVPMLQARVPIDTPPDMSDVGSEVVVSTSTMDRADWCSAYSLTVMAQAFHCMGMTRYLAIYLHKSGLCGYYDFYTSLYRELRSGKGRIEKIFSEIVAIVEGFVQGKNLLLFADRRFSDFYWPLDEGLFLSYTVEQDAFFDEIGAFAARYVADGELLDDLIAWQKACLTKYDRSAYQCVFRFDWLSYFSDLYGTQCPPPEKKETALLFLQTDYGSLREYAKEVVWRGRRREETLIHDVERIG